MTTRRPITITIDRRLLEHPRAYHFRRMKLALWVYLLVLSRLPNNADSLEVQPAEVAFCMGLPEGTIRSWLGHLRRQRYLGVERTDGGLRLSVTRLGLPVPPKKSRAAFFTPEKVHRALGEQEEAQKVQGALSRSSDAQIRRALASTLAVPDIKIRKSRTALFLYLLAHDPPPETNNPRH